MTDPFAEKSTVEDIRRRFDADVERFSNLETGQSAAVDAPLALELIAQAAAKVTPGARRLLYIGCGAGNFTLRTLAELPGLEVTLVDLSRPMLQRASERLASSTASSVTTVQSDIRDLDLKPDSYDVIVAAAVLHHLRHDQDWQDMFSKLAASLTPGGAIWVFDLVQASSTQAQGLLWQRYSEYLVGLGGPDYRDGVLTYIDKEDTPRPLMYQLDLLRQNGLEPEVLHVNTGFAAFGGIKPR